MSIWGSRPGFVGVRLGWGLLVTLACSAQLGCDVQTLETVSCEHLTEADLTEQLYLDSSWVALGAGLAIEAQLWVDTEILPDLIFSETVTVEGGALQSVSALGDALTFSLVPDEEALEVLAEVEAHCEAGAVYPLTVRLVPGSAPREGEAVGISLLW